MSNGIRIRFAVFPQRTGQTDARTHVRTDRPTDRPRESLIAVGRCATRATRSNNKWNAKLKSGEDMEIRSSHYVENITPLKRSSNCKSNISRGQTNNKCYMSTFCANRTRFRIDYNSPALATMIMVVSAVAWNTRRCKAAIVTTTLQPEHQQQQSSSLVVNCSVCTDVTEQSPVVISTSWPASSPRGSHQVRSLYFA